MSAVRKRLAGALLAAAAAMTVAAAPAAQAVTTTADHREPHGYSRPYSHHHPYGPGHGHPRGHKQTLKFRCHAPAHRWNNHCLRITVPPRASVHVHNRRSARRPVAFRIHRNKIVLREGQRGRLFHNRSNRRVTVHLAVRSTRHDHRVHTSGTVSIRRHR